MAYLTVQRIGSRRIRTCDLSEVESFDIGRASDCDCTLNDTAVSRHHCIVEKQSGGKWRLSDHDSRHGIKLNHIKSIDAMLQDGDLIRISKYHITFHDSELAQDGEDIEPSLADDPQCDDSATSLVPLVAESERERLISLEREIRQARSDGEDAKHELESLRADIEALSRERDELIERLGHSESESATTQQNTSSEGHEDDASDRREIETLHGSVDTVTRERDDISAELDRVRQLMLSQAEAAALSSDELKLLRVQLAGARDDRDAEHAARENAEQQRDDLAVSVDKMETALREQVDLVATIDDVIAQERAARDQLAQELDEFRSLRDSINENIAAMADREESWTRTETDLRAELDSATQHIVDNDTALETMRQEKESLTVQIDHLTADSAESAEKYKTELAAMRSDRDEAVQRIGDLEAQIQELTAASEMASDLQKQHADLVLRVTDLESALNDAEAATFGAEDRAANISQELAEAKRRVGEYERGDIPSAALSDALDRANAAERAALLAQQNLDQYKDRFKELATDRERSITRIKIVQSQLQKAKTETHRIRAEAKEREVLLSEYIRRVSHGDASEASVVELTDEEIRRARAAGATIVEVDGA